MWTDGAKRSQSAITLGFTKKQGEPSTQRASKRFREQTEDDPLTITLNHAATGTVTEEVVDTNVNRLPHPSRICNTDGLAVKQIV